MSMAEKEYGTWEMITSVCVTPGAEGKTVYGVLYQDEEQVFGFPDVDASPTAVEILLECLRRERPEPCHFKEIITDFIDR